MLTAVCVLIEAQILRHSQPLTRPRAQPCTCAYAVYLCLRSVPVPTQCTCAYAVYLCLRSVPVPTQCTCAYTAVAYLVHDMLQVGIYTDHWCMYG
jgi:hypothetical protein